MTRAPAEPRLPRRAPSRSVPATATIQSGPRFRFTTTLRRQCGAVRGTPGDVVWQSSAETVATVKPEMAWYWRSVIVRHGHDALWGGHQASALVGGRRPAKKHERGDAVACVKRALGAENGG